MHSRALRVKRLTRAALCGLLAATALPAFAAADPGLGIGSITSAPPVAVPTPTPVEVPAVSTPAVSVPDVTTPVVSAPAVPTVVPATRIASVPAASPSARKFVKARASVTVTRSKGGKTSARARAKAQVTGATASVTGSFFADSFSLPVDTVVTSPCTFEAVHILGRIHFVVDGDKAYSTLQATGVTLTGAKYTSVETRHEHDAGLTFTQYDRFIRAAESAPVVGGEDDFFLKTSSPPPSSEMDCR